MSNNKNEDITISEKIDKVYSDFEENISEVGREIADAKNQGFDSINFGMTLVFIVVGGGLIVFGPEVFGAVDNFFKRVGQNGLNVGFRI